MSRRALLIVAAIAVISVVLTFIANDGGDGGTFQGRPFVPEVQAALNTIDRVEITAAGNETVATLSRAEEGWSIDEKAGFAANVATIRAALLDLAEAKTIETKTSDSAFYDRLGVEDIALESAGGVAVTASTGGEALPTVILGDGVGTSYRYARRADQAESYLIDRDPEVPSDLTQWLVTDIMDVRGTRVQRVTIEHADGETVALSKTERGQSNFTVAGVPEDRELSYPGVANVVGNALSELKLEDVARFTETDAAPVATIEYVTFDGLVVAATAYTIDEQGWLTFDARFDAGQAEEFATEPIEAAELETSAEAEGGADAETSTETQTATDTATDADTQTEAEAIAQRVSGWRYRIPSFKYDQITRRMEDLLKAADAGA